MARYTFRAAADNYEPHPRDYISGRMTTSQGYDSRSDIVSWDGPPKDAYKAIYVLDFGDRIEVRYVAGWSSGGANIFLQPFPLSVGTRPDNGRPIDMSGLMLGPRRAYHLKLTEVRDGS